MLVVTAHVRPGASREAVILLDDGSLDVRPRARPIDGKANDALIALLAERLGLRARHVRVVRGARARRKHVEIDLATADELRDRLGSTR